MIYYDKVTKVYDGGQHAVEDITLGIDSGEFVSIVGHSGAGKTTLLKMLFAEVQPTEGAIYFGSRDMSSLSNGELLRIRRNMGTIFQDFRLLPTKTVYENIAFALEVAGRTDEEIKTDVPHVLELVGLFDKMWNFPGHLSGGEQQRVAIARALVNSPDILLADEPTGNLDTHTGDEVFNLLLKFNKEKGITMIIVTHNERLANRMKRIFRMVDGKIYEETSREMAGV